MKCPYRPIEHRERSGDGVHTTTSVEFPECYGSECPFYGPESKVYSLTVLEHCKKAIMEGK